MTTAASLQSVRDRVSPEEWRVRVDLAACYRLLARFGMTDLIYTHVSAAVPGPEEHFLLNPYGMLFDEVTASALVKVDLDGRIVMDTPFDVNPAGFTIHSAVHGARRDVGCVVHTHTKAGMAVASVRSGLLPLTQFALQFYDRIAYHDYEGIALDLAERERLVRDLGDRRVMILRNHGLLTAGATVPHAFSLMFYLNRSCEVQLAAQSMGDELVLPPPEVCEHTARQYDDIDPIGPDMDREWQALLRLLDRDGADYRT
ncbi:MAG TPA: class II aldolase/adducin family protein [Alphaproteobacteria bacterium]|nr:class II aldolase/adducin family protein [Alphaproteobacteria bacterium]